MTSDASLQQLRHRHAVVVRALGHGVVRRRDLSLTGHQALVGARPRALPMPRLRLVDAKNVRTNRQGVDRQLYEVGARHERVGRPPGASCSPAPGEKWGVSY